MKRVGWWRFEVAVPIDWDITAQGRTRSTEVFRLSDSNYTVRLEVLLEKVPFEKAKSSDELLELYKKNWEKRLEELEKKEGVKAELKHVSKGEAAVRGHRALIWTFRVSGAPMLAAVWYCEKSERAVALTFTPRGSGEENLFRSILDSVKCHFDSASERVLWSTLLTNLYLPQTFQLVTAKFAATVTYCLFADDEMERYLLVGYSGLASFILNKYRKGLKEWFEKEILKEVSKSIKQQLPKLKYNEENKNLVFFKGETFSLTKKGKRILIGKTWYDRDAERIFVASVFYPLSSAEEARSFLNDLISQLSPRGYDAKISAG